MTENQAGLTALITAYARAYHAVHDSPIVFDDWLADQFYTTAEHAFFDQSLAGNLSAIDPGLAAKNPSQAEALSAVMQIMYGPITLGRSRYCEDCLEKALASGLSQYVILGAGLDTFAFRLARRRPDLLAGLRVYELDHPVTQAMKRERVAYAGWDLPPQLTILPIDFSHQTVAEALSGSTFDPSRPAFFSWLGVSYYLTREVVTATLSAIRAVAAPGSTVVFDYLDEEAFNPGLAGPRVDLMLATARQVGEPMKSFFAPSSLSADVRPLGWELAETLTPGEIQSRYFANRPDRLQAFEHVHFARLRS